MKYCVFGKGKGASKMADQVVTKMLQEYSRQLFGFTRAEFDSIVEYDVINIMACRKCGTVRVHCSSASLCVGCRSLSGIRLPSFKTFYLYRTLCGVGDLFPEKDYPERNPSLPDCNRSNDDFLDVYPDVQI